MKKDVIPNISLGEFGYEGTINLNVWRKYIYGSNGVYSLDIGGDMIEDNPRIYPEHIEAYNYAISNQREIHDIVINVLFKNYSSMQNEYGYDEDELEEVMPSISNINEFENLIGLSSVHIMNVFKGGIAYTGYEFSCTWDEEHGFGVMMHKDRVVKFGGADTSILSWIAAEDLK